MQHAIYSIVYINYSMQHRGCFTIMCSQYLSFSSKEKGATSEILSNIA